MSKLPIRMTSDGRVLRPADAWAEEQMNALPRGVTFNVRPTQEQEGRSRRYGLLNLWWAGLALLVDNIDDPDKRWPTARKMHNLILEELGFIEPVYRIDGSYRMEVDSIALDNMSDEDFDVLFERARAFVVEHWSFDPWDAWKAEKEAEKEARERLAKYAGR